MVWTSEVRNRPVDSIFVLNSEKILLEILLLEKIGLLILKMFNQIECYSNTVTALPRSKALATTFDMLERLSQFKIVRI